MKFKRLFTVLLITIMTSVILLSGCTGTGNVMGLKIDDDCYINQSLSISYSEDLYQSTLENIQELIAMVEKGTAPELFCQILCVSVSTKLYKLIDALNVANLYYYSDMSDQENLAGYEDLYDKYTVVFNEFKKLYPLFADSKYKSVFYGDLSDEEIAEYVEQAVTSDELVALQNQVVSLQTQYNSFSTEQIYGTDFDQLYSQLIEANNQIAKIYGYNNFLDYSYELQYSREFSTSDTLSFANHLNRVVPAAESAYSDLMLASTKISNARMIEINNILSGSFLDKANLAILDGFYKSLGEDIYYIFNQVIDRGYFFIANNPNAYQGAYTNYFVTLNAPYMYFSADYATVQTFVHEFGHYLRFFIMGNDDEGSYELMETHSQGAEWLFMSYLSNLLSSDEQTYVVNSRFVDDSYMLLLAAIVGTSEIDCYQTNDLTNIDFDNIVTARKNAILGETTSSIYKGYLDASDYFRLVAVNSPGYYISYSISLVSSMELYVKSLTSYEDAVSAYNKILNAEQYLSGLSESGLGSPFELTTISQICSAFSN